LYSSENQIKPEDYLYKSDEEIPGNKCQEIRLKMNSINKILFSYFREVVRETFEVDDLPRNKIFLTKAINLKFEAKVIELYKQLIEYLINTNEQETTLEDDLKILRSGKLHSDSTNEISFPQRMMILYRTEKKRILHAQLEQISLLQNIFSNQAEIIKNFKQDFI